MIEQAQIDTLIDLEQIRHTLKHEGVTLLRDVDMTLARFSGLINALCPKITYDPARTSTHPLTQQVDAGCAAVGLHIENGHTPSPPDIVTFFSQKSARSGSQTTWCDGAALYQQLPTRLQKLFRQPIVVTRSIPKALWQRYVANALKVPDPNQVEAAHLRQFVERWPGQTAIINSDQSCHYSLTISPLRSTGPNGSPAFANALLGPSFNYAPPSYRFTDGSPLEQVDLDEVHITADQISHEVEWRDGDVLILDNRRVMHGRRKITIPLSDRQLFIGMGMQNQNYPY